MKLKSFCLMLVAGLGFAATSYAVPVPYCSVTAVEGQNYLKWANFPTPGVTPQSLCNLAMSELRFNYNLTPTGAFSFGLIDNAGPNFAWVKCNNGYVQYVNAFGLGIIGVLQQVAANQYQCLFHINHNG